MQGMGQMVHSFKSISRVVKARWLCAAALIAIAAPALAEDTDEAAPSLPTVIGATSYSAADFARFAPKTARDMLGQVPGFVIQQADEKRGLGQASTNILINGERFSGKSNDVATELTRISANDVVRIDIVDGATLNVPGLSGKVANLIIKANKKISGQFQWNPETRFRRTNPLLTNGQASITGSTGNLDYTFSFINNSSASGNHGPGIITDGTGVVIERREEDFQGIVEQPKIGLGLKYKSDAGTVANLNAAYQITNAPYDSISLRHAPTLVDRDRRIHQQSHEWNYELGGDYEFTLGPGRWKLIGIRRDNHNQTKQKLITRFADGSPSTGQRYEFTMNTAETIMRSEYSWKMGSADWQIAAEGALNILDFSSMLGPLNASGGFDMAMLEDSTVKEKRGEISLSYGRPLSPSLTLQALIAEEYSELSQTGPTGLTRTFYRPKGFVSLAWKASPRLNISAKIERVVGQLNFFDFMASLSISNDTSTAGNPNLVPPQSWNGQIEATRNLGAYGTITARLFGQLIEDVVDTIPIGATGQAVGNLDKATLVGFQTSGTLNLDPFGIAGAKINFEAKFRKSRIEDPLTGVFRQINNTVFRYYGIDYRHDIKGSDWAYGVSYGRRRQAPSYRLDEWQIYDNIPGSLSIFIEHKNVLGLTMKASLYNMLGSNDRTHRVVYDGRRTNPVLFNEDRDRNYGQILTLSISGKF
jgi:hypothetical protein